MTDADSSARDEPTMTDIDDTISLGTAFALLDGPAKIAMCPRGCGEPLISTFEKRGAEFHCLACGGWFGFLAPRPAESTRLLVDRADQLRALFDSGVRGPADLPSPSDWPPPHPQIHLSIWGYEADVDEGIADDIIKDLWKRRIRTFASCQGRPNGDGRYIACDKVLPIGRAQAIAVRLGWVDHVVWVGDSTMFYARSSSLATDITRVDRILLLPNRR